MGRTREEFFIFAGGDYTIADMAIYPRARMHKGRGIDNAGYPQFMCWFEAMEARPAVQRNNAMPLEIRERMNKAAESKPAVNIYDTRDKAEHLAKATRS